MNANQEIQKRTNILCLTSLIVTIAAVFVLFAFRLITWFVIRDAQGLENVIRIAIVAIFAICDVISIIGRGCVNHETEKGTAHALIAMIMSSVFLSSGIGAITQSFGFTDLFPRIIVETLAFVPVIFYVAVARANKKPKI